MKKIKKKYLVTGVILCGLALGSCMGISARAEESQDALIPERVFIGEIPVGGMTQEEASQAVEEYFDEIGNEKITFKAGSKEVSAKAGELGVFWQNPEVLKEAAYIGKKGNLLSRYMAMKDLEREDKVFPLEYGIDKAEVVKFIENSEDILNSEVQDAQLKREDGAFITIPESEGIYVDVESSIAGVESFFASEWDGKSAVVELVADVVEPEHTEEELSKVKDVLGSFRTSYANSNAGRKQNVQNGTSKINGALLYPGDEFSVYEVASPFVRENGYEVGGAYENGKVVESIGGGICQVSTTLYNAVIRAELEVIERYPHSMTVSYVKPSEDAAIAGTYKDFKFKNNLDSPVYIEGYTSGGYVYFNVYGEETRDSNRKVEFVSEVLATTTPGVVYQAAPDQPIGYTTVDQSEHVGYKARLRKIVTVNGEVESNEVFNTSSYRASDKVILVGTASADPNASAAVNAAIATQDEATVNAAIAAWNDAALAASAETPAQEAPTPETQTQESPATQPETTPEAVQ